MTGFKTGQKVSWSRLWLRRRSPRWRSGRTPAACTPTWPAGGDVLLNAAIWNRTAHAHRNGLHYTLIPFNCFAYTISNACLYSNWRLKKSFQNLKSFVKYFPRPRLLTWAAVRRANPQFSSSRRSSPRCAPWRGSPGCWRTAPSAASCSPAPAASCGCWHH